MVQDIESSNETRMRILEATAQLLAASPTGKITNRAVCEAAGVKAPTLYHYFGDKDSLVQAVVMDAFERYLEQNERFALRVTLSRIFAEVGTCTSNLE